MRTCESPMSSSRLLGNAASSAVGVGGSSLHDAATHSPSGPTYTLRACEKKRG